MKLNKLTFRNFASYGDKDQVIEFGDNPGFYLIEGPNGTGKSTIPDVLRFLWYGRVDGKNKAHLANRMNGGAYVKGEAMIRGRQITVERGISPNIMTLSVDGIPYDKANAVVGPSDYLENELLEIPFYVFNNAICLSVMEFKSFLKMSAKDKRLLIDRIFAFDIITKMRDSLTKLQTQTKRDIDRLTTQIETSSNSYKNSMSELDTLTIKLETFDIEQEKQLQEQLTQFKDLLAIHIEKRNNLYAKINTHKSKMSELNETRSKCQADIASFRRQLKLYDNMQCPTCQTELTGLFHESIKTNLISQLETLDTELTGINDQWTFMQKTESDYRALDITMQEKGTKIQSKISVITQELTKLNNKGINEEISSIRNIVNKLNEDISNAKVEQVKKDERLSWFKILESALNDKGGIKQLAMQTIIPAFNNEIYRMMAAMHLNYQVLFDDNFDAKIMHMGEDIPPGTLSTGETVKIDVVALISFIRLLKTKFPSLNVIFLDEIFATVDPDGIHATCKILKSMVQELDLNIFILSPRPLMADVSGTFDYKIDIKKTNTFSNMSVTKIN